MADTEAAKPFSPTLSNPDRDAAATVRGFLSQAVFTVLRWLALDDSELLVCEGNEDIDVVNTSTGEMTFEQIKELADRISARSAEVYETIFHFAETFVFFNQKSVSVSFVFTVTAALANQRKGGAVLPIDVLSTWSGFKCLTGKDRDQALLDLKNSICRLLAYAVEKGKKRLTDEAATQAESAIAAMEKDDLWEKFFDAVVWNVAQPSLEENRANLGGVIQALFGDNGHEIVADRLIAQVLQVTSRRVVADRVLRRSDAESIIRATALEMGAWAESQAGVRYFSVVRAIETVWKLLSVGRPELKVETHIDAGGSQIRAQGANLFRVTFAATEAGEAARAVVARAMAEGFPQSVPHETVQIALGPDVAELLPMLVPPDGVDPMFIPGFTGNTISAEFGWKRKQRLWDLERFVRKFHTLPCREAIGLKVLRDGSQVKEFGIPLACGLQFTVLTRRGTQGWLPISLTFERAYVGVDATMAAYGEGVLLAVRDGSFFACFVEGKRFLAWETNGDGADFESWQAPFQLLADLNEAAGADLVIPDRLSETELLRTASMVELFMNGRRTFGAGSLTFVVEEEGALRLLQEHAAVSGGLPIAQFASPAREEALFGQSIQIPPTVIKLASPRIGDPDALLATEPANLPVTVELLWDDGGATEEIDPPWNRPQ